MLKTNDAPKSTVSEVKDNNKRIFDVNRQSVNGDNLEKNDQSKRQRTERKDSGFVDASCSVFPSEGNPLNQSDSKTEVSCEKQSELKSNKKRNFDIYRQNVEYDNLGKNDRFKRKKTEQKDSDSVRSTKSLHELLHTTSYHAAQKFKERPWVQGDVSRPVYVPGWTLESGGMLKVE